MARPEATADLLGVPAVALDRAGPRCRCDGPARETAPHQVEAAPEEMDGRTLAVEPAAVLLQDDVDLRQHVEEASGVRRLVRMVHTILGERDRVGHLGRPG